jgi:hypothetical protein
VITHYATQHHINIKNTTTSQHHIAGPHHNTTSQHHNTTPQHNTTSQQPTRFSAIFPTLFPLFFFFDKMRVLVLLAEWLLVGQTLEYDEEPSDRGTLRL